LASSLVKNGGSIVQRVPALAAQPEYFSNSWPGFDRPARCGHIESLPAFVRLENLRLGFSDSLKPRYPEKATRK